MLKIAIHEPLPVSAVSYYRSIGTLSYLPKLNNKIKINIPGIISWNSLVDVDILYMERPQQDSDLEALKLAKDFNVKIWVDYDDLLHKIPPYNPCFKNYKNSKLLKNIETAIELADVVTVSTPAIKEYYSKFNSNIHVIENAHNDYRYPFEKIDDTVDAINWRGSATHRQDLLSVAEHIFSIANKYDKWAWTYIGNDVWYITDRIERCFNLQECDTITYNKFILDLKSAIQIVPLVDNEFNKSKSNIGWVEGTYVGSCTICPDLPEFKKPGAINYNTQSDSFGYYLEKAINSKSFRKENYLKSYEYIKENLLLSDINKKRIEIIDRLI